VDIDPSDPLVYDLHDALPAAVTCVDHIGVSPAKPAINIKTLTFALVAATRSSYRAGFSVILISGHTVPRTYDVGG
jgi:hypothetical protein